MDVNYYLSLPRTYCWGLATFEQSYSLKVDARTQGGAGLAHNIIEKRHDSLSLNISDGILYESSKLNIGDTAQGRYSTFRNSLRLRLRIRLRRYIDFEGTSFLQSSFSDGSDYIFRSNASLKLRVVRGAYFTTSLVYNKVSRTSSENLLLIFGLTLDHWL